MDSRTICEWLREPRQPQREKLALVRREVAAIRALPDAQHEQIVQELSSRINSPKLGAALATLLDELTTNRTSVPDVPHPPIHGLPLDDCPESLLEELFAEAEQSSLAWSSHPSGFADDWMKLAQRYNDELARRARNSDPVPADPDRTQRMHALTSATDRIVAARVSWNEQHQLSERVTTNPPAAPRALHARAAASRHPLPPSYLDLLRIHDGISGFSPHGGELLSSRYRGEYDRIWRDWLQDAVGHDCPADIAQWIIIAIDDDGSVVAFDATTRRPDGEMEVIEIRNYRELQRFDSLERFLEDYASLVERHLDP